MKRSRIVALVLLGLVTTTVLADGVVNVPGTGISYPSAIRHKVGGRDTTLVLTGVALRKKLVFNVYTIGSYLEIGAKVSSPEELANLDAAKQLHLVMERDMSGKDLAAAFRAAVRMNHAAPSFEQELATLDAFLQKLDVKQGDQLWLTTLPGVGFHGSLAGKSDITIKNVAFARAVWEIYLGRNNLGAPIKAGLVSRL
jgi:hypothetical protein